MFATQVLPEDLSEDVEKEDDFEETVGFILVNDSRYEIKKGETKIGRDPTECSIVLENFTVSKVHAVIESEGIDDTFIYDNQSTNQTKLGKKTLKPHCRYKLENDSNITFGNITAKFVLPCNINESSQSKADLENFKPPHGLEDIFEVVTQVTVPHPHNSGKIHCFGNERENFQTPKTPDLAGSGEKPKKSLTSPKDSVGVLQTLPNSKDSTSRREFYNSSHDASGIFSLTTQCQIVQPCLKKESKPQDEVSSENHENNELDPIKALLCDGQDDVLCTFMSLHSPVAVAKEIKTEIIQEDYCELFDVQTQVQAVPIQPQCRKSIEQTLQLNEDSCNRNSPKASASTSHLDTGSDSTPLNIVTEKFNCKDVVDDDLAEDCNRSPLKDCINTLRDGPVVDVPEESDVECYFEKTVDLSAAEESPENNDLICTQKFTVLPKTTSDGGNDRLNDSNENFTETQIFDFGKERNDDGFPFVVCETPEKDSETHMTDKTELTQRNVEEDFISTQVFCELTRDRSADVDSSGCSERNDDEDFIATQPVDFRHGDTEKNEFFQEPIPVQNASIERSPDLLECVDILKTSSSTKPSVRPSSSELLEKTDSLFATRTKTELVEGVNIHRMKDVERIDSSGEETESDLEIIFDKSETSKKILKVEELSDADLEQPENNATGANSGAHEDNDSNSSYIFQLEPETHVDVALNSTAREQNIVTDGKIAAESDSDATDCEDIALADHKMPIEQELPGRITSDETQIPASTPPEKVSSPDDGCKDDKESPTFEVENANECWSQLSLEMPATQDMENTLNKILRDKSDAVARDPDAEKADDYRTPSKKCKTEVKIDTFARGSIQSHQIDSPLKRLGDNESEIEAAPPKKSKIETSDRKLRSSEKQFLKLWQVHDIEHIQPYRTRSSLKSGVAGNKTDVSSGNSISNKFETSRRESRTKRKSSAKLNSDITAYFCKKTENKRSFLEGRKKETSPKPKPAECFHRVLRSSVRHSDNILEGLARQASSRSTRNWRFRKEEYWSNPCVNVVFTGFDCESLEKIIINLGGKKTNDLSSGDVVVADKVRRTVKFLSAIALSLPITSPQWLLTCRTEKKFVDPWNFILKDEESEIKWGFELKAALERSKNAKLMQGLSVYATPSAKPPVKDLMAIVKYCGGTPLFEPPDIWPKKTIIVSCSEDKKWWPLAKFRNVKIVHYECILIGVLRQKLDYKTYKLR